MSEHFSIDTQLQTAGGHCKRGEWPQAEAIYRQILQVDPNHAGAISQLAFVATRTGRLKLALELMHKLTTLQPREASHHNNLGTIHLNTGNVDAAIESFRRAVELQPNFAIAQSNLGGALNQRSMPREAETHARRAVELKPDFSEAHNNLGEALLLMGRSDEGVSHLRRAIELQPANAKALNNLSSAMRLRGSIAEALQFVRRAVEVAPDYAEAWSNYGNLLQNLGQVEQAIECFRHTVKLRPGWPTHHSNLLLALHYLPNQSARELFDEHLKWAAACTALVQGKALRPANDRSPDRKLRIGYLSADFRRHPVATFMEPIFANHDRSRFEIFVYSDARQTDSTTRRLVPLVEHWCDVSGFSGRHLIDRIVADQIDVLIDLAGHTPPNRMLIFAMKPAPVQIAYLGYPDTSGLGAMDFRITDAHADPPGESDTLHSEKLIRLPHAAWCYRPPADAPPIAPPPSSRVGHVVFGSFNNLAKHSPMWIDMIANILLRVPDSRLLMKRNGLSDPTTRQSFLDAFSRRGIDLTRIELRGRAPTPAEHLAAYNEIDIALDTYPYHGTTTTCEAMWMGVPVITLAGDHHCARVGVSLLSQVGRSDLVADSTDHYVQIATQLAADESRMTSIRSTLRDAMRASPLMDEATFVKNLEAALRNAWHAWCRS